MRSTLAGVLVLLLLVGVTGAEEVPMSLRDCLDRALANSLEIREGRYLRPIAETSIMEADSEFDHLLSFRAEGGKAESQTGSVLAGADVLQEQTFSGGVFYDHKVRTGATYRLGYQTNDLLSNSQFYDVRPLWTNALTFTVTQPVLRGAWTTYNEANTRIAEADARAAGSDYTSVVQDTLAAVERAYWDLVFLRADLAVKEHSVKAAEELVRIAGKRRDAGAGTRVDYVQAEAGLAERVKQLILAEQAVADGQDRLRAYVAPFNRQTEQELVIVPTDPVDAPSEKVDLDRAHRIRSAFDHRPDVLATMERLEAAGIRTVQAENELLPQLDVFGTVGINGLDDTWNGAGGEMFSADYPEWLVGLSFEVPLGNLAARARHRRAILQRSRLVAGFESLKNRVVVDVRTAVRTVETARREVEATGKSVVAAQAQYDAEIDRVRADRSTAWQLLQIEDELTRAKSQEVLAKVAYRASLVALEKSSGTYLAWRGLTPPPDIEDPPAADEQPDEEQGVTPESLPNEG